MKAIIKSQTATPFLFFLDKVSQLIVNLRKLTVTTLQDDIDQFLAQQSDEMTQLLMRKTQQWYEAFEDFTTQEFLAPVSEKQINEALEKFVVKNVNAIMDLYLEVHDGWLRLYATVNYKGIFAKLAVNLSLIHVQLDRYRQRFVFGQISDTEVLSLYSDNYAKTKAIQAGIWAYRKFTKQDPLGMILGKINLVRQKEEVLYLDIGRWLQKNQKIMDTLYKVQVNHGFLAEQQLMLKVSINIADVINLGTGAQLITEADNPNGENQTLLKKQAKTVSDPTLPSDEVLVTAKAESTPIEAA